MGDNINRRPVTGVLHRGQHSLSSLLYCVKGMLISILETSDVRTVTGLDYQHELEQIYVGGNVECGTSVTVNAGSDGC